MGRFRAQEHLEQAVGQLPGGIAGSRGGEWQEVLDGRGRTQTVYPTDDVG